MIEQEETQNNGIFFRLPFHVVVRHFQSRARAYSVLVSSVPLRFR